MRNRLILLFASLALVILAFEGCAPILANAQSATGPQLIITWHATDSMAPASYQAKLLPSVSSPITASVEVISQGALVNLANQTIYWYLDGNLVGSGIGKQTITVNAPSFVEITSLRAELPNYPGGLLINTTHIPITNPQAVIVAPYPGKTFTGSSLAVKAVPYFFQSSKLSQLSYQWVVNGQAVTSQEDPQNLSVNLANGSSTTSSNFPVQIDLLIQANEAAPVNARSSITLTLANS